LKLKHSKLITIYINSLHLEKIGRWSSSLYQSTFLSPLAGAEIQEFSIPKIVETLKVAVNEIITSAGTIIKTLQDIDRKEFQDRLEAALSKGFEELQNEFSEPLPKDKTERYKRQETIITQAVEKSEDILVDICSNWKIPEDTVRADFDKVKPHLIHTLLIAANLVNNHPELVWLLSSSVIIAIIPEGFILRPILRLFGFSRRGPVKDSIAARAHSFFYGANVPKGSLFALFESVGMKMGKGFLTILKFFWPF